MPGGKRLEAQIKQYVHCEVNNLALPNNEAAGLIFEHNVRKTFTELGFLSSKSFEDLEELDAQIFVTISNAYGEAWNKKMKSTPKGKKGKK